MIIELKKIEKIIAIILAIITLFQLLYGYNKYCSNLQEINYNLSPCIEKLIFLMIPTEVSIIQFLESFPILMLIVLFLYWKFVAPYTD